MRKLLALLGGLLLFYSSLLAQNRVITGKVTDENGVGIPNVSVIIKGTTTASSTSTDGSYSITVSPSARALLFSSIGMPLLASSRFGIKKISSHFIVGTTIWPSNALILLSDLPKEHPLFSVTTKSTHV